MPVFTDAAGRSVAIRPLCYLYSLDTIRSNWYANWISMSVRISGGHQSWESESDILTDALTDLTSWIRSTLDGGAPPNRIFWPAHQALRFELKATGDPVHLTGYFSYELCPSDKRESHVSLYDGVPIDFYPGVSELRKFADDLKAEMERFPWRDIEGAGT